MQSRISADDLDQALGAVEFPATIEAIKTEVANDADVKDEVISFFEQIAPRTEFDSREELLNMAEQSGETLEGADIGGDMLADDMVEGEVI